MHQWAPGDVADGVDVRLAGAHLVVDDNAIAANEAGVRRQLHIGQHAYAHQHGVRRDHLPVFQLHAGHVARAFEADKPRACADIDAGASMDSVVEMADLRPRHAGQDLRHSFEHGHLEAELRCDRRRLKTDIARAYHHQPRIGVGDRLQSINIIERPQFQNAGKVRALHRQPAWARARCDHQLVPADGGAGRKLNRAGIKVDPRGGDACQKIDPVLGIVFDRLQEQPVGVQLTLEIGLRQRRPLIGRLRLVADDRDGARKTAQPQRIGRLPTSLAGADDDDARGRGGHAIFPLFLPPLTMTVPTEQAGRAMKSECRETCP